ncbi:dihydroxy-acid dehydratase [Salinicoccus hispanicus]|uniref:Dihydroxy-acid dehydratase n=1 Tax=Salinicoccus hispanicus TaxID=157225 RepID=A0A6N8U4C6_9STAP|nr:dihydroxy-acid dehydratase [Salinicoccus hispanicus]MXQ51325.1 dihydroxy-acid dehydratase [Salinicoccus hispanicus]
MKHTTSYGDQGFSEYIRMAFQRNLGYDEEDYGKPIIGICNTFSEINRCHAHLNPIINSIKNGVIMAGGIPLEFPTISVGEMFTSPTTMLYRNLVAMDTEEMIKAQPIDGVVLVGGCDKMAPGQLMGAFSADKPAILFTGGPMANGEYKGEKLGACSDCRKYWQEYKAGTISKEELMEINAQLAPTNGHCMVMGSASTIAVCSEAMGMMLPGSATPPATVNERLRMAKETGKAIVKLVEDNTKPSDIVTRRSFENAITTLMAVGGSTNTVIHLIAMAKRLGIKLTLKDFEAISRKTPIIGNLRPAGKYQMEEFYHAGGVSGLLSELKNLLHLEEKTVSSKTLKENIGDTTVIEEYSDVIRTMDNPIYKNGGIKLLQGNLVPSGAIIKPKAILNETLMKHTGKAVIFESIQDMEDRVNSETLEVDENSVLILRNAGPVGAPGMPEAGGIPIPQKLLEKGIRDMVRISDCRMSGTASGSVVLHASPEAAVGGPLALVKNGDEIHLNVAEGVLEVLISDEELKDRKNEWKKPIFKEERGYSKLYRSHVLQASEGCDFDFLIP